MQKFMPLAILAVALVVIAARFFTDDSPAGVLLVRGESNIGADSQGRDPTNLKGASTGSAAATRETDTSPHGETLIVPRLPDNKEVHLIPKKSGPLVKFSTTAVQKYHAIVEEFDLSADVQRRFMFAILDLQMQRQTSLDAAANGERVRWDEYREDMQDDFEKAISGLLPAGHPAAHRLYMVGSDLVIARAAVLQ